MQPVATIAPWITAAVPGVAASLAFVLSAQVRRVASAFSKHHFEKLENSKSVPPEQADDPANILAATTNKTRLPERYTSDSIAKVYAKNGEGGDAVIGMLALIALSLNAGIVPVKLSGLVVVVGAIIAFAIAGALWLRDANNYQSGWLNVSRTGWLYIALNILLAIVLAVSARAPLGIPAHSSLPLSPAPSTPCSPGPGATATNRR